MPVTPTFSEDFYKKLGQGIAEEFVNWFNQAHTAFRATSKRSMSSTTRASNPSWSSASQSCGLPLREELGQMAATLRQEIASLEIKLCGEIGAVESRLDKKFTSLQAEVRSLKILVRWLFGFWAASTVTILAAIIRMAGT